MKTFQFAFPFLSGLFFAQCEETVLDQDKQFNFGDTITISLHDTVFVENLAYQIRFDSVLTDSRCPLEAECIWQGEVKTIISVFDGIESKTMLFGLYQPSEEPIITYKNISITYVNLLPYP
jgi:hypothetical protein